MHKWHNSVKTRNRDTNSSFCACILMVLYLNIKLYIFHLWIPIFFISDIVFSNNPQALTTGSTLLFKFVLITSFLEVVFLAKVVMGEGKLRYNRGTFRRGVLRKYISMCEGPLFPRTIVPCQKHVGNCVSSCIEFRSLS